MADAPKFVVDVSGAAPVEALVPLTPAEKAEIDARAPVEAARVAAEATAQTNTATIHQKAEQALTANAAFLANATPTNAQILAQVRLLTRETNALIRLLLNDLDDVSDT